MGDSDLRIVAIALILFTTYGIFVYLNANAGFTAVQAAQIQNSSQFDTPDSSGFISTLDNIGDMNVDYPEIFFINSILFGTIAFLLLFVGLRFLRGTG